jgi:hypothetical protein
MKEVAGEGMGSPGIVLLRHWSRLLSPMHVHLSPLMRALSYPKWRSPPLALTMN